MFSLAKGDLAWAVIAVPKCPKPEMLDLKKGKVDERTNDKYPDKLKIRHSDNFFFFLAASNKAKA